MKSTIVISVGKEEREILERRAKKELMTIEELVEDIVRRSAASSKLSSSTDNVDDKFLTFFSRKTGKRRKKR